MGKRSKNSDGPLKKVKRSKIKGISPKHVKPQTESNCSGLPMSIQKLHQLRDSLITLELDKSVFDKDWRSEAWSDVKLSHFKECLRVLLTIKGGEMPDSKSPSVLAAALCKALNEYPWLGSDPIETAESSEEVLRQRMWLKFLEATEMRDALESKTDDFTSSALRNEFNRRVDQWNVLSTIDDEGLDQPTPAYWQYLKMTKRKLQPSVNDIILFWCDVDSQIYKGRVSKLEKEMLSLDIMSMPHFRMMKKLTVNWQSLVFMNLSSGMTPLSEALRKKRLKSRFGEKMDRRLQDPFGASKPKDQYVKNSILEQSVVSAEEDALVTIIFCLTFFAPSLGEKMEGRDFVAKIPSGTTVTWEVLRPLIEQKDNRLDTMLRLVATQSALELYFLDGDMKRRVEVMSNHFFEGETCREMF